MWQRLDRIFFNNEWLAFFNITHVEHLSLTASDHSPIIITISMESSTGLVPFQFQNMWLKHDNFFNYVKENWEAPLYPSY